MPRAFRPDVGFADRSLRILLGATNFARWGGRSKVQSEDLLMALAAGNVLSGLFPDVKLSLAHVRKVAAKHGSNYILPDDKEDTQAELVKLDSSLDNFL